MTRYFTVTSNTEFRKLVRELDDGTLEAVPCPECGLGALANPYFFTAICMNPECNKAVDISYLSETTAA